MTSTRKSGSSLARGPMVKSSAAAPASTCRFASAWTPAMSPASNSALVLLNPGLIRSPMMVNSGAFAFAFVGSASFKADSPHENSLKAGQRPQFETMAAKGEMPGAIAQGGRGKCHAHADAGGIADLLEARQRQGRKQSYPHRAFQSDVGAKSTGDHHAFNRVLLHRRFAQ